MMPPRTGERAHGGLTNRLVFYLGLAVLWAALAFILNPVDAIAQTTMDIGKAGHLRRALPPGLILLGPVALIALFPQGVWFSLPLGSFILVTLPYSFIGGAVGWICKRKMSSRPRR